MWSFLLKLYKLYHVPCKYPIGYLFTIGEAVALHLILSGWFGLPTLNVNIIALIYPFETFFLLVVGVDTALWVFLLPRSSPVFPELSRRHRINLFSFLTAVSLLMMLTLVFPQMWDLGLYSLLVSFLLTNLFSSILTLHPLFSIWFHPAFNWLVFHLLEFFTDYDVIVSRIYWAIGFRYVYLLSATERSTPAKYLRIPLSITPAIFLTGVFQLTLAPPQYVVSSTIYCVVVPSLILEAIVFGTSATFHQNGKKIRVSVFDIFRRSITLDILGDDPKTENMGFTDFREELNVWSGLVVFKDQNSGESLLVVPSLHPGPFLSFCGSLLSYKISKELGGNHNSVMVPHSPSTHDFNPTSASEIHKIVESVRRCLREEELETYEDASPIVIAEERDTGNNLRVFCQAFGKGDNQRVLILCDVKNGNNGDFAYSVGNYLIEAAKSAGAKDAIIIDKHYNPHEEECPLFMEDPTTLKVRKLVQEAVKKALKAKKERIHFTGAKITKKEIERVNPLLGEEIGKDGITLYVLKLGDTEKVAYLLFDANTIEPTLGEKIIKLFKANGFKEKNILIMTTDTHQYPHFLRPLGARKEIQKPIIAALRDLLQKASEPRRATASVGRIKTSVNVWGFPNGERFLTLLLKSFPVVLAAFLIQWMVGWLSYILTL